MIVLGRIVAPHGVRGAVKIHPFGDDPLNWRSMRYWWLGSNPESTQDADWKVYRLESLREQGSSLVASFEDVADRNAAESLDGLFIAAPREDLPRPGLDEYYWGDLIGLSVINAQAQLLGTVSKLLETGAHDVLQVELGEGKDRVERLIPFVAAFIKDVDLRSREIRVEWEADW
ncbi:MAG: ribosome maturation factor RimM [Rhodocyclaceae bacterium]